MKEHLKQARGKADKTLQTATQPWKELIPILEDFTQKATKFWATIGIGASAFDNINRKVEILTPTISKSSRAVDSLIYKMDILQDRINSISIPDWSDGGNGGDEEDNWWDWDWNY